ncbi:MAG: hypothetical protein ABFC73_05290, partial [Clostridiaceae bacterium]
MNVSPFAPENDPLDRFLLRIGLNLPAAAQWSRCVGAEARSFRSLACRSSAALSLPLAARRSV